MVFGFQKCHYAKVYEVDPAKLLNAHTIVKPIDN